MLISEKLMDFRQCNSLHRIEIPAFLVEMSIRSFSASSSLSEITVASGSHLQIIDGFQQCDHLSRIEIPASNLFGKFQRMVSIYHSTESPHIHIYLQGNDILRKTRTHHQSQDDVKSIEFKFQHHPDGFLTSHNDISFVYRHNNATNGHPQFPFSHFVSCRAV
jgi:hypothetical protein